MIIIPHNLSTIEIETYLRTALPEPARYENLEFRVTFSYADGPKTSPTLRGKVFSARFPKQPVVAAEAEQWQWIYKGFRMEENI